MEVILLSLWLYNSLHVCLRCSNHWSSMTIQSCNSSLLTLQPDVAFDQQNVDTEFFYTIIIKFAKVSSIFLVPTVRRRSCLNFGERGNTFLPENIWTRNLQNAQIWRDICPKDNFCRIWGRCSSAPMSMFSVVSHTKYKFSQCPWAGAASLVLCGFFDECVPLRLLLNSCLLHVSRCANSCFFQCLSH